MFMLIILKVHFGASNLDNIFSYFQNHFVNIFFSVCFKFFFEIGKSDDGKV